MQVLRSQDVISGKDDAVKSVARMCSDDERRDELGRSGAVSLLVETLTSDAADPSACGKALSRLFAGRADLQEEAVRAGALRTLVARVEADVESAVVMKSTCRALEHVATGVGAASRRDAAAEAGALPALVRAICHWRGDEDTRAACCAALRSLTRDSADLQEAARRIGCEADWLR